jgi:hypothetical protein
VFAKLDMVKTFENKFKLVDTELIIIDTDYRTLGTIALIACLQKSTLGLDTDHEWRALATKLPQSNNAMQSQ